MIKGNDSLLTITHLSSLHMARFEFVLCALEDAVLPPFLGTTFRGAFGHALKEASCTVPQRDCSRCLLLERCVYPATFETRARAGLFAKNNDVPRPFVFIPPLAGMGMIRVPAPDEWLRLRVRVPAGERVVFGMNLFGSAVENLPYIIYAIGLMARHGLGAERASFTLETVSSISVHSQNETIYTHDTTRLASDIIPQTTLASFTQARMKRLNLGEELRLVFVSPTRLRSEGRLIETLDFPTLISSLSLRFSMLSETQSAETLSYDYKAMIAGARRVVTKHSALQRLNLRRYSSKQDTKLNLDGLVGEIVFAGDMIKSLMPLVVAGEFLNIGSATAFGLGRYLIVDNQL